MIKRSKFKSYLILIFIFQLTNLNAQKNLKGLEQELLRLGALSGGKMGIGVIHLETDQRAGHSARSPLRVLRSSHPDGGGSGPRSGCPRHQAGALPDRQ